MTNDEYILSVLQRYVIPTGPYSLAEQSANSLKPYLRNWASPYLSDLFFSGSYAKGTGVKGSTDIDIFISLSSNHPSNLADIFNSLYSVAQRQSWNPRRQNVSIGIQYTGQKIDLVPGKIQAGSQNYHSIYKSKANTWTQTNVALQTQTVRDSGRINEIRAIKIWRNLRNLDFPSFFLELAVIQSLHGRSRSALADNVWEAI
ncbi:nucleotidyltransferase domain-containing protein, partial [bacterium]|nr:nucleotidyltransferase domain-containing protein [bacterium]